MTKKIQIKCTDDNTTFDLTTDVVQRSNFLNNLIETYSSETVFEIPDIKGSIFKLIVEWLEYHKDKEPKKPPQPLRTYNIEETVGKWEDEFMDRVYSNDFNKLFAFLNAANFLDIPILLELGSAKTACLTKDLNPQQFKELFKIEEDCTEEDLKTIEEEVFKEREILKEKERQQQEQ